MNATRRILAILLSLCLVLALPVQALAEEYDLANGDISVNADESGQYVTQAGGVTNEKQTTETVITQSTSTTDNTITLSSSGDAAVQVTIEDVNIEVSDKNAIDITDGSSAVIAVSGENTVVANYDYDGTEEPAGIHIAQGSLTITDDGDDATEDILNAASGNDSYGAGIGAEGYEDFDADLTITGDITVNAESGGAGAGMGSGYEGDFSGTVNISDGASVNTESGSDGAGIGSGDGGDFSGTVNITDATVTAKSGDEASGIGSGEDGDFTASGVVTITNATVTAVSDDDAAGIGSEDDFYGTVTILNSTVTAIGADGGAGIGGGDSDDFGGSLTIQDSDVTVSTGCAENTAPLGAGVYGDFTGSISITGDSSLHALDSYQDILIGAVDGAQDGSITIGSEVEIYDYFLDETAPLPMDWIADYSVGGKLTILDESGKTPEAKPEYQPDTFWRDVYKQVMASEAGAEIKADADWRTSIPVYVLKAVAEKDVTLIVSWHGGEDITITASTSFDETLRSIPLADLAG